MTHTPVYNIIGVWVKGAHNVRINAILSTIYFAGIQCLDSLDQILSSVDGQSESCSLVVQKYVGNYF